MAVSQSSVLQGCMQLYLKFLATPLNVRSMASFLRMSRVVISS